MSNPKDDNLPKQSIIYSLKAGFGFIKFPKNNLFFHFSSLVNVNFNELQVGDEIEFTLSQNDRGDDIATKVKRLTKSK